MPTNLHEIKPGPDVEERNDKVLEDVDSLLDDKLICGYAFVVWDAAGKTGTAFRIWSGPIGSAMMPSIVHDALMQNICVTKAVNELKK